MSDANWIPLCVPQSAFSVARHLGALQSGNYGCLAMPASWLGTEQWRPFSRFLPVRFRPDLQGPFLQPRPVPLPLWGWNLRSLLHRAHWDHIRREAYRDCGYRCRICGMIGPDWPVEADEVWQCDDKTDTQSLSTVTGLCPACHGVRHWGRSSAAGKQDAALAHMARVNAMSVDACRTLVQFRMDEWLRRSERVWDLDISWVARTYGFPSRPDAAEQAAAAHQRLTDEAERNFF